MRGCFPTKWAILRDEPAGVSWHRIDAGVDTGPILGQTVVPLNPGETDATLYLRLTRLGMELFDAHVPAVAARAAPPGEPQDESRAIYFPQAQPLDGAVDWSRSAAFIERAIRAFTHPPYPGLRAKLGPLPLELRGPVDVLPGEAAGEIPGVCSPDPLEPGAVRVSCGDGVIRLRTVLCDGHEQPALEALRLAQSDRFQVSST
jgi:methionyl-tRNA formyltransferase